MIFLVRARVVIVDSNLRPFNGTIDTVTITNPSDSLMRMWRDTQLVDGKVKLTLFLIKPLSSHLPPAPPPSKEYPNSYITSSNIDSCTLAHVYV